MRGQVVHEVKTIQPYWDHQRLGFKDFELRKDDRDYQVGDVFSSICFDVGSVLDGVVLQFRIKYVLRNCPEFGLMEGYCILGLEPL